MEELYQRGRISRELYNKYDFYKKGFWVCFIYVLWDMLRSFGWL